MSNPFETPTSLATVDLGPIPAEARDAGRLGMAALMCLAIGSCTCGMTTMLAPLLGAGALWTASRVQGVHPPESPAGLYLTAARLGGWTSVIAGGAWLLFAIGYGVVILLAMVVGTL